MHAMILIWFDSENTDVKYPGDLEHNKANLQEIIHRKGKSQVALTNARRDYSVDCRLSAQWPHKIDKKKQTYLHRY